METLLREPLLQAIHFGVFKRVSHVEDRCVLELCEGPAAQGTPSPSPPPSAWRVSMTVCNQAGVQLPQSPLTRNICVK